MDAPESRLIESRIKAAKFPATRGLESFDFKAIPLLTKVLTMERTRREPVDRREHVIALGARLDPLQMGETERKHMAIFPGHRAQRVPQFGALADGPRAAPRKHRPACCAAVFGVAKRISGRRGAITIASASAASFVWRLSCDFPQLC